MSAEAILPREPEPARPPLDLSSPLFTVAVGALLPLLRLFQIARDYLARKVTPLCCVQHIPSFLIVTAAWGLYTPVVFWLGRRFPPSRLRNAFIHLGAMVVLSIPVELYWWFLASPEQRFPPPRPFGRYAAFRLASALIYYALLLGAGVLRDRYLEQSRYARLLLRLERQLADAELAALRTQLDPALLGASLDAVEKACREDDRRAERLVVALADFLRITLDQIGRRDTTLARELARLEPLAIVWSELSGSRIALDVAVEDAERFTAPPALLASLREMLSGDATLRVRREGETLIVSTGTASRTFNLERETQAVPNGASETVAMPKQSPFALRIPTAIALMLLASLFARALIEAGANKTFLDYVWWSSAGTLFTLPGCFLSVWAARRVARSRSKTMVVAVLFLGTFAAAFLSELAFSFIRPRWDEINSVAAMSGFLPAVARSRAVAFQHLLFVVLAFFALAIRYDERARDVLALQAGVREAQLRKLRAQLRPHFLFNSLNSILGRLGRDREAAAGMAASLRRFLHTTFVLEPHSSVPLSGELDAIREYLDIERNRAGARMRVEWRIDDDTRDVQIPALLLQPLVENAVQHGVASVSRSVRVIVSARRAGRFLELTVEDDGAGHRAHGGGRGLGFATTRGLLAAFYGGEAELSYGARDPEGFVVRLQLPLP